MVADQVMRCPSFPMLESFRVRVELGGVHAEGASLLPPSTHRPLDRIQDLLTSLDGDPEVRPNGEERIDGGLGSGFRGDPGLGAWLLLDAHSFRHPLIVEPQALVVSPRADDLAQGRGFPNPMTKSAMA